MYIDSPAVSVSPAAKISVPVEALEKLQGKQVLVRMTEIIIEENVACALVELPKGWLRSHPSGKGMGK